MRINKRVFAVSFFISLIMMAGVGFYIHTALKDSVAVHSASTIPPRSEEAPITDADRKDLSIMTKKSTRVNVLLLATNSGLADLMMVVSYDPTRKLVDVISIPRDTYNKVEGYSKPEWLKLNATYKMKRSLGGADGVRTELQKVLKIPINYYVEVDFKAVREYVDIIGGVEVDIPRRLVYDDPYDQPPLHIDFRPGKQVLGGDDAVKFLRWRKNNSGYGEGDLQRIERQHKFVKDALSKSMGVKLPEIISSMSKYVKTDMALKEMLYYAGTAIGVDKSTVQTYRIPGVTTKLWELSYFIHNPVDTEKMMLAIYNRTEKTPLIDQTISGLKQLDPNAVESETTVPNSKRLN